MRPKAISCSPRCARSYHPRKLLLAGTGRESTRATIDACRRAGALGADAVLVRPPAFYKNQMTPDALIGHYRRVADASPVPVLLYNLPATGVDPHIVASSPTWPRTRTSSG